MNMKTKQRTTFLLIGAFLLIIALLSSCVDVPSEGPTPPGLQAEYRIIHAATDMNQVGVTVDGKALGNLAFKGVIPHQEYTSGTKNLVLSNGEEVIVSMSTDYRGSFILLNAEGDPLQRTYLKLQERRMFDNAAFSEEVKWYHQSWVDGVAVHDTVSLKAGAVRPVHCSPDAGSVDIVFVSQNPDLLDQIGWGGVGYRVQGTYAKLPVGTWDMTVYKAGTEEAVYTTPVYLGNIRTTVLIVGSFANGTLTALVLQDN